MSIHSVSKKIRHLSGFSIVELIVVIGIIVTISLLTFVNYKSSNRGFNLDAGVQQLITDIQEAQNNALNGKYPTNLTSSPVAYGLTISANATSYTKSIRDSGGVILSTEVIVSLPKGIEITTISGVSPPLDLTFDIFTGLLKANGVSISSDLSITLEHENVSVGAETIVINPLGIINTTAGTVMFQCSDGTDNDGDLLTDFPDDPGCVSATDNNETDPPTPECSDGSDNDLDGFTDLADPGCSDGADASELDLAVACDDGVDNDGDTFTDTSDPGCIDPTDPSEFGTELSFFK